MAWLLLLGAAALEVVWALALKRAGEGAGPAMAVLAVGGAAASFGLLALALRDLPVGLAYAVWTGVGAAGVALAGTMLLGEPATAARLACIALIVAAVAGLRLTE